MRNPIFGDTREMMRYFKVAYN